MPDGLSKRRRVLRGDAFVDDDDAPSVQLLPGDDARVLAGKLDGVVRIVLVWAKKATEGRGYTQARILREQLGFTGHIRAVGEVLVDHVFFMRRCGVDEFVLRDEHEEEYAVRALSTFSVRYQGAADEPLPLHRRVAR